MHYSSQIPQEAGVSNALQQLDPAGSRPSCDLHWAEFKLIKITKAEESETREDDRPGTDTSVSDVTHAAGAVAVLLKDAERQE